MIFDVSAPAQHAFTIVRRQSLCSSRHVESDQPSCRRRDTGAGVSAVRHQRFHDPKK